MLKEVNFQYKARYYKLGEITSTTRQIWWVFHGYGQLAEFFIRKFSFLEEQAICIIAPEGLSKFYLNGTAGRVEATWMTRENRSTEIQNYISYLNSIHNSEQTNIKIQTTLLGFSQGTSTAVRWAMESQIAFDRLILWAGLFPADMDFIKGKTLLQDKEVIEVLGTQDQFITTEKRAEMHYLNNQLQITPTIIEFEGKHELNQAILTKIAFS
jgi:predicted esterase